MSDSKNKEAIEVLEIASVPVRKSAALSEHSSASLLSKKWVWVTFIVLLMLALYVVFLLPGDLDRKRINDSVSDDDKTATHSRQEKNEPIESGVVTSQPDALEKTEAVDDVSQQFKVEAGKLLASIIELEAHLDRHAVKKWAAEKYADAVEQGRIGDEHYRRQQYRQASETFQLAINRLQDLKQRIQPTLMQALTRGEQALTQGDQNTAFQQFALAIAISPQDMRAINGVQRTKTLEQLFALLQRGSSFEFHNQLQQAKLVYEEAITLDPLSDEARAALARVDTRLADEEFSRILAVAYQALQNRQYTDARAAFKDAKKLKPDASEPVTGLNKVDAAIREAKIENLLVEAEHFVQLQQWQQAATSFEKVLRLNNNHKQASSGLRDSNAKAMILDELKAALASSDQLYKDKVLQDAEKVLESVAGLTSPGAIIEQHYEQLQRLVRVAATPVPVILVSDNHTEVVVFKVKRLGKFKQYELQLRPGPYTVVGTRNGYRDVRKVINIKPESNNSSIMIVCEESI
tara:strand:+ start:53293 stop:54852 length:1560 start_codon:yes stop_codon:yes gene_type:complete